MLLALVAHLLSTARPPPGAPEEPEPEEAPGTEMPALDPASAERLQTIVRAEIQFVYRTLRRMLPADAVDDAVQQTFVVAARKIARIEPGRERAFLGKTALWVAAFVRRTHARRRETPDSDALDRASGGAPSPEDVALQRDRRRQLDEVLDAMPLDLRTVFVLFELEGLGAHEIAPIVGAPVGTVASRLRRAREEFHTQAQRLRARASFRGGTR